MGKSGIIVTGLVAIALVIGIIVVANDKNDQSAENQTTSTQTQKSDNTTPESANLITYSSSSFSPSTLTVKPGDSLTIKNNSDSSIQIQSNPHPIHTDNSELNVGTIQAGETATFTVTKTGTFGYHNHLNSSETATIVVQER